MKQKPTNLLLDVDGVLTTGSFIYTKKGICNSYIDSVFSNDQFVTKTKSRIYYNQENEPIKITRLKSNKNGDTLFISKDVFEYLKR